MAFFLFRCRFCISLKGKAYEHADLFKFATLLLAFINSTINESWKTFFLLHAALPNFALQNASYWNLQK